MRVLAPDLRGFGESGKPTTVGEYAVSRSVADMTALLDAVGVERADVVGHDLGRKCRVGPRGLLADTRRPARRAVGRASEHLPRAVAGAA